MTGGWAATNTLHKCISNPVVPNIYDEDARAALALVEAALDAAEKADAVLHEYMPEWYGDREWPELDALASALRAVREGK